MIGGLKVPTTLREIYLQCLIWQETTYTSFANFLCQGNWSLRVRGFCPTGPQALWREDQGLRDELGRGARRCHGGRDRRRRDVEAVDGDPARARQVEGEEERRWRDGR